MGKTDARVDAYIANSADFAKPILKHLRQLVHKTCPEADETIKWQFPTFTHKGLLCGLAAFKEHCTFGFWKWELMVKNTALRNNGEKDGMGQFGRITSLADLPKDKVLIAYIKEAVRLNEAGIKVPRPPRPKTPRELVVPDYFQAALDKNKQALAAFNNFSYSHRKEYLEWITEAKREETRNKRIKTAIQWLAQGKARNWKYMNC